jgi:predicted TIM-barrel fold metal-dependent hydrolase
MEDLEEPIPLGPTAVVYRAQSRYDRANYRQKFMEMRDGAKKGLRYEDILPGSFDPAARVKEQQEDQVDAEVLYTSPPLWGGIKQMQDSQLRLACFKAYNDWIAEFSGYDRARLVGVGSVPTTGVDDAVAEFERCVGELGLRTVALESYPSGVPDRPEPEDDRFWAKAEELGVPIAEHAGFTVPPNAGIMATRGAGAAVAARPAASNGRVMDMATGSFPTVLAKLILSGVFDRFPGLTFVGVEVNIGWIPYYLEQFDARFRSRHRDLPVKLDMLPSEYFRRNVRTTFITDPVGVDCRYLIGVDNIMWSSDFPHSVSSWPIDVELGLAQLDQASVPEGERERIMWRTCADLYRLPYETA